MNNGDSMHDGSTFSDGKVGKNKRSISEVNENNRNNNRDGSSVDGGYADDRNSYGESFGQSLDVVSSSYNNNDNTTMLGRLGFVALFYYW